MCVILRYIGIFLLPRIAFWLELSRGANKEGREWGERGACLLMTGSNQSFPSF